MLKMGKYGHYNSKSSPPTNLILLAVLKKSNIEVGTVLCVPLLSSSFIPILNQLEKELSLITRSLPPHFEAVAVVGKPASWKAPYGKQMYEWYL